MQTSGLRMLQRLRSITAISGRTSSRIFASVPRTRTAIPILRRNFASTAITMDRNEKTHADVSEYYGKILTQSSDLKTNACCTGEKPPEHIRKAISRVHDDVVSKYYGTIGVCHLCACSIVCKHPLHCPHAHLNQSDMCARMLFTFIACTPADQRTYLCKSTIQIRVTRFNCGLKWRLYERF